MGTIVINETNTVTLVIAVVGLVLSVASLGWQMVRHRLEQPRLTVQLLRAWAGAGSLVSGPPKSDMSGYMHSQGMTLDLLAARVRNTGRYPITIRDASARLEDGTGIGSVGGQLNPSGEDKRVQPFSAQTWYVELEPVRAAVKAMHALKATGRQKVWMIVEPEVGPVVRTKDSIDIDP